MSTQVIMPQLGESVVEGTVSKWLKAEGQPVNEFEPLLEINTDKVDTEIPSPAKGVLLKVYVPDGQTVKAGAVLGMIGASGEAVPQAPVGASVAHPPEAAQAPHTPAATPTGASAARRADVGFLSPVVAKMAAEDKGDLGQGRGPGTGGGGTQKEA